MIKEKLERTQNILKSIKNSDNDPKVKKSLIESMYQLTRLSNYSGNYLAVDRIPTGRQILSTDGVTYYATLNITLHNVEKFDVSEVRQEYVTKLEAAAQRSAEKAEKARKKAEKAEKRNKNKE